MHSACIRPVCKSKRQLTHPKWAYHSERPYLVFVFGVCTLYNPCLATRLGVCPSGVRVQVGTQILSVPFDSSWHGRTESPCHPLILSKGIPFNLPNKTGMLLTPIHYVKQGKHTDRLPNMLAGSHQGLGDEQYKPSPMVSFQGIPFRLIYDTLVIAYLSR